MVVVVVVVNTPEQNVKVLQTLHSRVSIHTHTHTHTCFRKVLWIARTRKQLWPLDFFDFGITVFQSEFATPLFRIPSEIEGIFLSIVGGQADRARKTRGLTRLTTTAKRSSDESHCVVFFCPSLFNQVGVYLIKGKRP